MLKILIKILLICTMCVFALTACEQQKQASAEVGAIPKTILDKATNDIAAAQALAAEKVMLLENAEEK